MTTQVHDILGAINEANEALKAKPQLESQIADLQHKLDQASTHSQRLELKINDYRTDIDTLHEELRKAKGERDDMGFRNLELEDKLEKALEIVRSILGDTQSALSLLNPPAPKVEEPAKVEHQPEAPVHPEAPTPQGQSATDPTHVTTSHQEGMNSSAESSVTHTESVGSSQPTGDTSNPTVDQAPNPSSTPQGKFSGMTYSEASHRFASWELPRNREEWIAGGGTAENWYH